MQFRTEISIPKAEKKIDHSSRIVLQGSCFTENIEKKLSYFKFKTKGNSHGILFNPKAVEKAIEDCILLKEYKQTDLIFFNELWLSLNHHGKFSSPDPGKTLSSINKKIRETHFALTEATHTIITLGTAWVYRFLETETTVANCHKIPQKEFSKELLSVKEIESSLKHIIFLLKEINPEITIIFTVSPVRHLKDGFTENSLSKARLITAIHEILNKKSVFYFPAYEIMMDDLRDYRFYNEDMLHPNDLAVKYIWQKFRETWISESDYPVMAEIDRIRKALRHNAFQDQTGKHQEFLIKLKKRIELLKKEHPDIRFEEDLT